MLKITLMMLLVVASNSAVAGWVKVYFNHTETIYADFASEHNEGNIVKMLSLSDYKSPQKTRSGITYLSVIEHGEYDCKEEKVRSLSLPMYSKNMGGGKMVFSDSSSLGSGWIKLEPDNIDHVLWKHACGKPQPLSQKNHSRDKHGG